jgi:MoxR-like ATPase
MSMSMAAAQQAAASAGSVDASTILAEVEALGGRIGRVRAAIGRVIFGQDEVVDQTLITLLSAGHVLLVGVPGLGKSRLVETLGIVLGLATKRVQFTPDLMPADIIGSEVLDEAEGRRSFRFVPGPVFCQLLMADEINRASPRTQSALLQAMQEQRVAVAGVEHTLPRPFHVLATQNPIEQEGTYPLPEAQLDRFLMKIVVTYPSHAELSRIVERTLTREDSTVHSVLGRDEVLELRTECRKVLVAQHVQEYAVRLVMATQPDQKEAHEEARRYIRYGSSPRGAQSLVECGRVLALMRGRYHMSVDDIKELTLAILRHRVILNFDAHADGKTPDSILSAIVAGVTVQASTAYS